MSVKNQRGFSAVEVIIGVVVLASVGAVGYFAFDRMKDTNKKTATEDQSKTVETPGVPSVDDKGDLDAALKALDDTNVDASTTDSTELDSQANF